MYNGMPHARKLTWHLSGAIGLTNCTGQTLDKVPHAPTSNKTETHQAVGISEVYKRKKIFMP